MILADENIDFRIISALRDANIKVVSVYEEDRGITDSEVISKSLNPEQIILTEDKDFGEWVFAHHYKGLSVLFIRYKYSDTDKIIQLLLDLIETKNEKLFNHFTTITIDKIRVRKI